MSSDKNKIVINGDKTLARKQMRRFNAPITDEMVIVVVINHFNLDI